MLLDEATSALDANSEHKIQAALQHLMQAAAPPLIIAHRLATVMHADRILVFNEGELEAQGTHQELLITSPLYQRLSQLQFNH